MLHILTSEVLIFNSFHGVRIQELRIVTFYPCMEMKRINTVIVFYIEFYIGDRERGVVFADDVDFSRQVGLFCFYYASGVYH